MSLETLHQKFTRNEGIILDIREQAEYQRAHIPGSINMPGSTILQNYKKLPSGKDVFVICKEGIKSIGLAQVLKLKRIKARAVSPGGIEQWDQLGLPLNQK